LVYEEDEVTGDQVTVYLDEIPQIEADQLYNVQSHPKLKYISCDDPLEPRGMTMAL
jgi:hypothetical protein